MTEKRNVNGFAKAYPTHVESLRFAGAAFQSFIVFHAEEECNTAVSHDTFIDKCHLWNSYTNEGLESKREQTRKYDIF